MSYNKPKGFRGQRGSELHNAIVDWTRFDLVPYLRSVFADTLWFCVYDDTTMAMLLGTRGQLKQAIGARYPDGLWIYCPDDGSEGGTIVIEAGNYNLNKTLAELQVLHIGFDGQINVVNPYNTFIMDVADVVREYRDIAMGLDPPTTPICSSLAGQ